MLSLRWAPAAALVTGVATLLPAPASPRPEVAPRYGAQGQAGDPAAVPSEGLWEARLRFGPDARGRLLVIRDGSAVRAEIAGYSVPVHTAGDTLSFALPDSAGSFSGRLSRNRATLSGHWIQPRIASSGNPYASPLSLRADRAARYVGSVDPLEDAMTCTSGSAGSPTVPWPLSSGTRSATSAASSGRTGSSGAAARFG